MASLFSDYEKSVEIQLFSKIWRENFVKRFPAATAEKMSTSK